MLSCLPQLLGDTWSCQVMHMGARLTQIRPANAKPAVKQHPPHGSMGSSILAPVPWSPSSFLFSESGSLIVVSRCRSDTLPLCSRDGVLVSYLPGASVTPSQVLSRYRSPYGAQFQWNPNPPGTGRYSARPPGLRHNLGWPPLPWPFQSHTCLAMIRPISPEPRITTISLPGI